LVDFRYVFVILGGNDIVDGCNPQTIFGNLVDISNELKNNGVEKVFIASIMEREPCYRRTRMTRARYNQVRKSLNKKLYSFFRSDYVDMGKKLRYPIHYASDHVHPGRKEGGLRILKSLIHRTFSKTL
jgi:hypothetical protein